MTLFIFARICGMVRVSSCCLADLIKKLDGIVLLDMLAAKSRLIMRFSCSVQMRLGAIFLVPANKIFW